MSAHLARAHLLIQQQRPQDALKELAKHVATAPEDFEGYMLQGIAYQELQELKKATEAIEVSLSLEPDHPGIHFVASLIYLNRNRIKEAESHIRTAIQIDPEEADFHHVLGEIFFRRSQWQKALDEVEIGLASDPEDVDCINLKARCLQKLGRSEQARNSLQAAMNKNPDNSQTHANKGWHALREGDRKSSLKHFRESLRLEPGNEWARQGMVEALKSGNVLYRIVLNYMFWMSSMTPGMQWGIVIGAYFLYRFLGNIAANNPALGIVIYPILILYVIFVLSMWIADPLFNLLLRSSSAGRYILSEKERTETNLFGLMILLAVAFIVTSFVLGGEGWLFAGIAMFLSLIPISASFKCELGWPKWTMSLYTLAMVLLAIFLFVGVDEFQIPSPIPIQQLGNILTWGFIASFWVANLLIGVRPKQ